MTPRAIASLACAGALLAAAPSAPAQAPQGGFSSANVEWLRNVSDGPSSGARLVDGYFYMTTGNQLIIYDVAQPENPRRIGSFRFPRVDPAAQRAPQEDPDTNGKILLTTAGGMLQVVDVRDKAAPKLLSELPGVSEHTISCVLDCTWAYGSEGDVVDLRNPAEPKLAGNWLSELAASSTHDVTEVAPGLVLTATRPIMLLDVRANPVAPTRLASADPPGFVHATGWPHQMADDFFLAGGEAMGPDCSENASATFMTFDARGWQSSQAFRLIHQFKMRTAAPPQGAAPATTFCVHWFDENPTYRNGGLVGIGWYEHGARFLKISTEGQIEEIGWFLPYGGRTSGVYWITDRIAYTADYYRGLDVLRWKADIPAGRPAGSGSPGAGGGSGGSGGGGGGGTQRAALSLDNLVGLPSARRCARPRTLRIRVRRYRPDPVASVVVRVNGRRALSARGRKLRRPLRLRKLPAKRFSIQVFVRTRSGHTTAGQRTYVPCRAKAKRRKRS